MMHRKNLRNDDMKDSRKVWQKTFTTALKEDV